MSIDGAPGRLYERQTGLAERDVFLARVRIAAVAQPTAVGVLLVEFGSNSGSMVDVAQQLERAVGSAQWLGHLDTTTFGVILMDCPEAADALRAATAILDELAAPSSPGAESSSVASSPSAAAAGARPVALVVLHSSVHAAEELARQVGHALRRARAAPGFVFEKG